MAMSLASKWSCIWTPITPAFAGHEEHSCTVGVSKCELLAAFPSCSYPKFTVTEHLLHTRHRLGAGRMALYRTVKASTCRYPEF